MSQYYATRKIRIKRRRPPFPIAAAVLLVAVFIAFVLFARPTLQSVDLSEAPAEAARVTRDVTIPGQTWHMIELTTATDPTQARVEAARYVARGAAGYVWADAGVYRILGAAYNTREEAERVAANLRADETIDAQVLVVSGEPMTLRVTATQAQLQALLDGCDMYLAQIDALDAYARALDTSATPDADVRVAIMRDQEAVMRAHDRLKDAAGASPNVIAAAFLTMLARLHEAQANLRASEFVSPLSFSGNIKYNSIKLRMDYAQFLRNGHLP